MTNAFVSFASEDREFVEQMVQSAEVSGRHRVWHFVRDSRPARDYRDEIVQAIRGCDVFILVASPAALDSFQVDKEVQLAHECNKVFLLIQLDATTEDIQSAQPGWTLSLGSQSYLRLDAKGESRLFDDVIKTLNSYSPPPEQSPARWAADATLIQLHNLPRVLFQTPAVKEFLEGGHHFFVSANKGVGKTLLLKSKRARLMEQHTQKSGGRSDVLFLPQDKPYLDNLSGEWPTLGSDKLNFLADLRSSRRLWAMALKLSILSHLPDLYARLKPEELPAPIRHSLEQCVSVRTASTIVFRNLLTTQTIKSIHALLDRLDTSVEQIFRSIHTGVYCFIDTVEQGVSNMDRPAWMHLQAGLIEAAWDVMTSNNHVKIYASIREEAFASYTSTSKINLFSAVLSLRYSLDELHQMLDSLSRLYERESSFHQFVGRSRIQNPHCKVEEDTFRYVHRHTVGRPRDLVVISSEIARDHGQDSEERFRDTVNRTASNTLLPLVFSEMSVFLDCLRDEAERNHFFGLLSHNIISRQDVEAVCAAFNGLDELDLSQLHENGVRIGHPFCELFNCGLIGTVTEDRVNRSVLQQFRQPYDLMTRCESCLPKADYYLIHPSLHELISQHTSRRGYQVLRYIAVGHRYPWQSWYSELVDLQKAVLDMSDSILRNHVLDFVENALFEAGCATEPPRETALSLSELQTLLDNRNCEDAYLHLDSFLSALPNRVATE